MYVCYSFMLMIFNICFLKSINHNSICFRVFPSQRQHNNVNESILFLVSTEFVRIIYFKYEILKILLITNCTLHDLFFFISHFFIMLRVQVDLKVLKKRIAFNYNYIPILSTTCSILTSLKTSKKCIQITPSQGSSILLLSNLRSIKVIISFKIN